MYVAALSMMLGTAVCTGSWVVAGFAALCAVILHLRVILYEERILARNFPEDWALYSAQVSRWIPKLPPKD